MPHPQMLWLNEVLVHIHSAWFSSWYLPNANGIPIKSTVISRMDFFIVDF